MGSRVLVAVTSALVTIAFVELSLRLVAPAPACDDSLSSIFSQTTPGLHATVTYQRDAHGLRRDAPPPRSPDLRILCLGASTTDQATQSWSDTWCAQVARGLEKRSDGLIVEAAAFGRGGTGLAAASRELKRLLDVFPADLVIVLLGVNDVTWLRGIASDEIRDDPPSCDPTRSAWWSRSLLARRLAALLPASTRDGLPIQLEWHSANLPVIRERYRALPAAEPDPQPASRARWTQDLERMVADTAARGATVMLLGQPTLWNDDLSDEERDRLWFPVRTATGYVRASPGWLWREMRSLNEVLRAVAARSHVAFVDLDPLVPKDLAHFFDDCHFTDRGSARVAEEVVPVATRLLSQMREVTPTVKSRSP